MNQSPSMNLSEHKFWHGEATGSVPKTVNGE
jgi:hypothetical protein